MMPANIFNINYQKKMEEIISSLKAKPKLLLHACCAPCSSYVIECLSNCFEITIYYYNPNIYPDSEYKRRLQELKRFLNEYITDNKIELIETTYDPNEYYNIVKGIENLGERSLRCKKCYEFRMKKAAIYAKENNFDYFTTTLSISPYKNSAWINEIGGKLESELGIKYLYSDFKKKNGYKRSLELSKKYNLYRQDYCGCIYSKTENKKTDKIMINSI